mgnify:CR=1 FL=1
MVTFNWAFDCNVSERMMYNSLSNNNSQCKIISTYIIPHLGPTMPINEKRLISGTNKWNENAKKK